jgi:hypothetical protein
METVKHIFRVDRREINYLRVIIESYDGMAVVKTIDPQEALIEIQMSHGCERLIFELLDSLVQDEGIRLIEETKLS